MAANTLAADRRFYRLRHMRAITDCKPARPPYGVNSGGGLHGVLNGRYVMIGTTNRNTGIEMVPVEVSVEDVIDEIIADDVARRVLYTKLLTTLELRRVPEL